MPKLCGKGRALPISEDPRPAQSKAGVGDEGNCAQGDEECKIESVRHHRRKGKTKRRNKNLIILRVALLTAILAATVFNYIMAPNASFASAYSAVHHGASVPDNSTLVIIMGNLRGGERAWETLYSNVLDVNNADLALMIGELPQSNRTSSLFSRAKYTWFFKEYDDWAEAVDLINGSSWRESHLPKRDTLSGLWGPANGYIGSGLVIFVVRWFLANKIRELRLTEKYDRFVITRADHYYGCQHIVSHLDPDALWLPDGEGWDGYTDRHLVCSGDKILKALDILPPMLSDHSRISWTHSERTNPEHVIKHMWDNAHRLKVRFFERLMFTCAVATDTTRWLNAKEPVPGVAGLLKKYKKEYELTMRTCKSRGEDDQSAAVKHGQACFHRWNSGSWCYSFAGRATAEKKLSYEELIRSLRPSSTKAKLGPMRMNTLPKAVKDDFVAFDMEWRHDEEMLEFGISKAQVPKQAQRFMKYDDAKKDWSKLWSRDLVDALIRADDEGEDIGPQEFPESARQIRSALRRVGGSVAKDGDGAGNNSSTPLRFLIAGSISPWVEALVLNGKGLNIDDARGVLVTGRSPLDIADPRLEFVPGNELLSRRFRSALDVVVSHGCVEHDGLGRYGDPVNPRGDLAAVAEYHFLLRENGWLVLAVPTVELGRTIGAIAGNRRRVYSPTRLRKIWCGFDVVGERIDPPRMSLSNGTQQYLKGAESDRPVFILKKTKPGDCYVKLLDNYPYPQ